MEKSTMRHAQMGWVHPVELGMVLKPRPSLAWPDGKGKCLSGLMHRIVLLPATWPVVLALERHNQWTGPIPPYNSRHI